MWLFVLSFKFYHQNEIPAHLKFMLDISAKFPGIFHNKSIFGVGKIEKLIDSWNNFWRLYGWLESLCTLASRFEIPENRIILFEICKSQRSKLPLHKSKKSGQSINLSSGKIFSIIYPSKILKWISIKCGDFDPKSHSIIHIFRNKTINSFGRFDELKKAKEKQFQFF